MVKKGTTPTPLKGVYKLNPTRMVMKEGSKESRKAVTSNVPGYKKKPAKVNTRKTK
jgi:hypothetical protein